MLRRFLVLSAAVPLFVAGCDDPTGGNEGERVAIRFATSTSTAARTSTGIAGAQVQSNAQGLVISGSNGTLQIDDVRLIVAKFKLERAEDSCAAGEEDDDCEEFEALPSLLQLPLTGGPVTVASDEVPPGTYTELEFEVEDVEADEDDETREREAIQRIFTTLRGAFPGFPEEASMVVKGTFTPTGGAAQAFVVFFDAEIEVEKDLVPAVTVPGTSAITVNVDPAHWFKSGSQVVNLAALNGRLVEFELKLKEGFGKIEIDD